MRWSKSLGPFVLTITAILLSSGPPALAQQPTNSDKTQLEDACAFTAEKYIVELQQEDAWRRWTAAECLGEMNDGRAVEPLVQAIFNERFPRFTLIETGALKKINDPSAEDLLLNALQNEQTRTKAMYALGRLESIRAVDPILGMMKNGDRFTVTTGAQALADIKDKRALVPLCSLIKSRDEVIRRNAALSLGFLSDSDAVDCLIPALQDPDDGVRWNSADSLGELKAKAAVSVLIDLLKDPEEGVRVAAVDALGKIGAARAINPLITTLATTTGRMRWHAALALSIFDTPEANDALTNALHHGELDVVAAGYKYFLRKNDPDAIPALARAMREHGSYEMAEALANSNNTQLKVAASDWKSRTELQLDTP